MKGQGNIVMGLQQMSMAREHFESFMREHPGTKGYNLFAGYVKKISWVFNDLYTNPFLPAHVREGVKRDVESDCFAVPAIAENIALLSPGQREVLEDVVERLIAGESFVFDEEKIL